MSCSECSGSGKCYLCGGSGEITPGLLESFTSAILSSLPGDDDDFTCEHCGGSGDCPACDGEDDD